MCYHVKFSFPSSISLLSLRGDDQPSRHTYFSYINKPDMFPYTLHFTENGFFPPKILCNFHKPVSIAAILEFFSLLLISLFHLHFILHLFLSLLLSFPNALF